MSRQELRRRLHAVDPDLKIVSGRRRSSQMPMKLLPKLLTEKEAGWWGLTEMIPDFPPEDILYIESKWSKKALQEMADEYMLDRRGDKELLVQKLLYVGALDEEGELTSLPVGEPAEVPYVIVGNPKKFCCSLCGVCAPEHLLEKGKFLDRITWLREHYKEAHPGKWGKGTALPQVSPQEVKHGKETLKEMS